MTDISEIKSRIKRIEDTQKVTKAMYLIASAKYRKAKESFQQFSGYCQAVETQITSLSDSLNADNCRFISNGSDKKACLVITSDKGLAGDYNKSALRKADEFLSENPDSLIYVIGEKGKTYFENKKVKIEKYFEEDYTDLSAQKTKSLSDYFCDLFLKNEIGSLNIVYTGTKDGIRTGVEIKQILPLELKPDNKAKTDDFEFIPDKETLIGNIVPLYVDSVFHSVILQSVFSEQSARMVAMDSANSNAGDMLDELNLQYNHSRQNSITQEITEFSGERKSL